MFWNLKQSAYVIRNRSLEDRLLPDPIPTTKNRTGSLQAPYMGATYPESG